MLVTTRALSGSGQEAPPKFVIVAVLLSSPFMFPFFVGLFSLTSKASSKEEQGCASRKLVNRAVVAYHYGSVQVLNLQ
jgi:hypothetical protein